MDERPFSSEQTEILRGIWQSIKDLGTGLGGRIDQTNSRLDQTNSKTEQTNSRLDQTNSKIDQTNLRLDDAVGRLERLEEDSGELRRAMASMEMRLGSELTAVHGELVRLVDSLESTPGSRAS